MARPPRLFAPFWVLCVAFGCGPTPVSPTGAQWAPDLGLELRALESAAVELAYQPPDDSCPHVYRLDTDYDVLPLQEERNRSSLVLARHSRRGGHRGLSHDAPPAAGTTVPGELFYLGFRAGRKGARRDIHFGRDAVGPAAPTAACTARTWDPMEDALALGFPELSGRLTASQETWPGARVEGKCNKTACIDPESYGGGPDNHHRPCVTPGYEERLVGVFEVSGERVAAIESTWSDGHGTQGVWTERKTLFSVDHGRPIWSRSVIHHTFPQPTQEKRFEPIERTWTLTAIDGCDGSVQALGGSTPAQAQAEIATVTQAWESFEDKSRRPNRSPSAGNEPQPGPVNESDG